jgi:hypothetical protein
MQANEMFLGGSSTEKFRWPFLKYLPITPKTLGEEEEKNKNIYSHS